MLEISNIKDLEERHCEGDALMVNLLRDLGYSEMVEVFSMMEKWYA